MLWWFPQSKAVFQVAMMLFVIECAGDAVNIGSVSAPAPGSVTLFPCWIESVCPDKLSVCWSVSTTASTVQLGSPGAHDGSSVSPGVYFVVGGAANRNDAVNHATVIPVAK